MYSTFFFYLLYAATAAKHRAVCADVQCTDVSLVLFIIMLNTEN